MDNLEPKYLQIYRNLKTAIGSGAYPVGSRLPSEHDLVVTYGASRATVSHALNELRSEGCVERRAGSGTYVTGSAPKRHAFGLIIPDFGQTEIFEPICKGMVASEEGRKHILVWGKSLISSESSESDAREICRSLISNGVSGVFFAPMEANSRSRDTNLAITDLLSASKIPAVLLDRDIVDYPQRSTFDLVGIDNRRAGFVAAQHLIDCGCRRIGFIGHPHLAPSCVARWNGYRDAVRHSDLDPDSGFIDLLESSNRVHVKALMERYQPDGLVCSNDRTAAEMIQALKDLGISVPEDVRVVAFDDVNYAHLISPPLTTIHQPCAQLGNAAIRAMLERIQNPQMPARDILVAFRLVVRSSSGATTRRDSKSASIDAHGSADIRESTLHKA